MPEEPEVAGAINPKAKATGQAAVVETALSVRPLRRRVSYLLPLVSVLHRLCPPDNYNTADASSIDSLATKLELGHLTAYGRNDDGEVQAIPAAAWASGLVDQALNDAGYAVVAPEVRHNWTDIEIDERLLTQVTDLPPIRRQLIVTAKPATDEEPIRSAPGRAAQPKSPKEETEEKITAWLLEQKDILGNAPPSRRIMWNRMKDETGIKVPRDTTFKPLFEDVFGKRLRQRPKKQK